MRMKRCVAGAVLLFCAGVAFGGVRGEKPKPWLGCEYPREFSEDVVSWIKYAQDSNIWLDIESLKLPDWPTIHDADLWVKDREGYFQKRRDFLASKKKVTLMLLAETSGTNEVISILEKCPVDPFAEGLVVPAHVYHLWVYLNAVEGVTDEYLEFTIKNRALVRAKYLNDTVYPSSPLVYLAQKSYSEPSEADLFRWIKTDPRADVRLNAIMYSYQLNSVSRETTVAFCKYAIRHDVTNRRDAIQILASVKGGCDVLRKMLKDGDISRDEQSAIQMWAFSRVTLSLKRGAEKD